MKRVIEFMLLVLVTGLLGYGASRATAFRGGGFWFPFVMSSAGAVLALVLAVVRLPELWRQRRSLSPSPSGRQFVREFMGAMYWCLWVVLWPLAVALVGFYIGTALWITSFLRINAHASTKAAIAGALGACVVFAALSQTLNLVLPGSVIVQFVGG